MYTRGVLETLVLKEDYFDWRILDCTSLLMFSKVYIDLAEVGDGDVKRVSRMNVRDAFIVIRAYVLVKFSSENTSIGLAACLETETVVIQIPWKATR